MKSEALWLVVTKSRPLPGCEIDMDGCEFYFADAFVSIDRNRGVDSIPSAIDKVKIALLEDRLELAEVIQCVKFLPEDWVDQTESDESLHDLAIRASEIDDVVFSSFRSEEIQALYHYKYIVQESEE
ncbi:hypothetical protein Q2E61_03215 [Microbulbifer thermotolerans]|uniref:hypothetical protein n=1 Tax=Microbulbifer thermotolerans TaxID=252514 RepID=UPI0026735B36|nr:hypothetical protein [Microbulbifer thermotolerans]WKT61215.1 hypothetical protein Q2E61_03215 [Microbulbifer thermotolerans]